MNTESSIMYLLDAANAAEFEQNKQTFIYEILQPLSNLLLSYLRNEKNSPLSKLNLILKISSKLKQFLEESTLLRKVLFECGGIPEITVICHQICFYAQSFSEQIKQSEYAPAISYFSSSGFPDNLADLPNFLKVNLTNKYETLKEEASKAFAAA
jgi:hypothetical protein